MDYLCLRDTIYDWLSEQDMPGTRESHVIPAQDLEANFTDYSNFFDPNIIPDFQRVMGAPR